MVTLMALKTTYARLIENNRKKYPTFETKRYCAGKQYHRPHKLQAVGRPNLYPGFAAWPARSPNSQVGRKSMSPMLDNGEIQDLKKQISKLMMLVENQQKLLDSHKKEIEELKNSKEFQYNNDFMTGITNHKKSKSAVFLNSGPQLTPFQAQAYIPDRRFSGMFDARFHSTLGSAIPRDLRVLPDRIILVRHAESEGNTNKHIYSVVPDQKLSLTARGWSQAEEVGKNLREIFKRDNNKDFKVFFILSPYRRSFQTYEGISKAFEPEEILGAYEEVQLREQDFGNFQDPMNKKKEMAERLEFGRFFYRFPNGESGADVYDRITIFEDHLVRDINAGRYSQGNTNLVLVTHGLALRIILMRWFHWTVDQFLNVYNPDNCEPIILERIVPSCTGVESWIHTKMLYRIVPGCISRLRGITEEMMRPKPPFDNLALYL